MNHISVRRLIQFYIVEFIVPYRSILVSLSLYLIHRRYSSPHLGVFVFFSMYPLVEYYPYDFISFTLECAASLTLYITLVSMYLCIRIHIGCWLSFLLHV